VTTALRNDQQPALLVVSAEQLAKLADGREANRPQPVNGQHLHPDCPDCPGD